MTTYDDEPRRKTYYPAWSINRESSQPEREADGRWDRPEKYLAGQQDRPPCICPGLSDDPDCPRHGRKNR